MDVKSTLSIKKNVLYFQKEFNKTLFYDDEVTGLNNRDIIEQSWKTWNIVIVKQNDDLIKMWKLSRQQQVFSTKGDAKSQKKKLNLGHGTQFLEISTLFYSKCSLQLKILIRRNVHSYTLLTIKMKKWKIIEQFFKWEFRTTIENNAWVA